MANPDSQNKVEVKCPQCGAVLSFKAVPNYNEKPISCPRCSHKGIVKDFIKKTPAAVSEQTKIIDQPRVYIRCIETGEEYQLNPGTTTIGRRVPAPKAEMLFTDNDKYMSRLHISMTVIQTGNHLELHLKDEGAPNGTVIKGIKIQPKSVVKILPGDTFTMGKLTFVCRVENDAAATRIVYKNPVNEDGQTTLN